MTLPERRADPVWPTHCPYCETEVCEEVMPEPRGDFLVGSYCDDEEEHRECAVCRAWNDPRAP